MIVVNTYEGFVSEIRAYILGYRLASDLNDDFMLDLSQFYKGSFWNYHLDYLNIPKVKKVFFREKKIAKCLEKIFEKDVVVVNNGDELEFVHQNYNKEKLYYIINDSYCYDSFFERHQEYFYRYVGSDIVTKKLFSGFNLKYYSMECRDFFDRIDSSKEIAVGIHIRLGDFFKVGWIVEKDFLFYKAAIQYIREQFANTHFYVFSDDIEMAKSIIGFAVDIEYVHFAFSGQSDIEELMCLAKCDYRILDKKSTYGLFSETISRNCFDNKGLTLIIKERHFQDDAGNKEYVEKLVNTNEGVNKNEYLGWFKELDDNDIKKYVEKCITKPYEKEDHNYKRNYKESEQGKIVIFITTQSYSDSQPRGIENLAHCFAKKGYSTHFVGAKGVCEENCNDILGWILENKYISHGMNSLVSDVNVYSYEMLNKYEVYTEFVERIKAEHNCNQAIVIVRKAKALPSRNEHNGNKYVFIDFSDDYDEESIKNRSIDVDELNDLYKNAGVIITFDDEIRSKWEKENIIKSINTELFYKNYLYKEDNDNTEEILSNIIKLNNEIIRIIVET